MKLLHKAEIDRELWVKIYLLGAFWTFITDFFTGLFALIPQFVYFFYTCIASLVDVCQFLVRKFAGLDTYFVGEQEVSGDLLTELVNGILGLNGSYSALSTVFWSLIIFGLILMVLSTIISVIKSHYNYDAKKSHPKTIIGQAIKTLANFAIVPVCVIFGILLSNYLLQALDNITNSNSSGKIDNVYSSSSQPYNSFFKADTTSDGKTTYYSYDFFGIHSPTSQQTFSGMIFQAAAFECNRVRYGGFTASEAGDSWSDFGMFNSSLTNEGDQREAVASMIDFAFANNLQTIERNTASVLKAESSVLVSSFRYLQSAVWYLGTISFDNFSKYNVGLVWYFYNLWSFNFVVGFVGIIFALSVLGSIIIGLALRLLQGVALFLVYGPVIGITPLDNGNAFKEWKKAFIKNILMAYGVIIAFNLMFLILPYLQAITFFPPNKRILNYIVNAMLTIALLVSVKKLTSLISSLIGGDDASATGESIKKELTKPVRSATAKAVKVASFAAKFVPAANAAVMVSRKIADAVRKKLIDVAKTKMANEGKAKVSKQTYDALKEENDKKIQELQKEADELKNNMSSVSEEEKKLRDKAKKDQEMADLKDYQASLLLKPLNDTTKLKKSYEESLKKERKMLEDLHNPTAENVKGVIDELAKRYMDKGVDEDEANKQAFDDVYSGKYFKEADEKIKREQEMVEDLSKTEKSILASYNEHIKERDRYSASAKETNDSLNEKSELNEQYKQKLSQISELEGEMKKYEIKQHPLMKATYDIGGKVFKVAGSALGFDNFLDALKKETDIMDDGKMAIRTFAQALGNTTITKNKKFMTSSEEKDIKKAQAIERMTISDEDASKRMLSQIQTLENLLKSLKK